MNRDYPKFSKNGWDIKDLALKKIKQKVSEVEHSNIKAPKSKGSVDIWLLQTQDSYYGLSNSRISATDHSGMPLTPHPFPPPPSNDT